MIYNLKYNRLFQLAFALFLITFFWWLTIYFRGLIGSSENNIYTLLYPLISLIGAVIGFKSAYSWGGIKSQFGKAILLLASGLLFQFIGQAIYAYNIYILNIEVPYPSYGDIGYFGSVILYIIALIYLAKVVAVRISFKSITGKLQAFILPAFLLCSSYFFFLKSYEFDWTNPAIILLDFGYPIGQTIYVSLTVAIIILSRNTLGGIMKRPLQFLLFALVVQYFSDFLFLFLAKTGTWYVGGINDFLYSVSYFLMTLALTSIGSKVDQMENKDKI